MEAQEAKRELESLRRRIDEVDMELLTLLE